MTAGETAALEGFKSLCLNALVDITLFKDDGAIDTEAFQIINDSEEQRESDGFTGLRMVLLVDYGGKKVRESQQTHKTTAKRQDAVAAWLCENIRFPDPRRKPTADTVRHLETVGKNLLPNVRAMHATQEAEIYWGRATLFDEYSKDEVIIDRCRGAADISFVYEWIVMKLKRTTRAGSAPTNPTKRGLQANVGTVAVAKCARDAFAWIWAAGSAGWKDFQKTFDRITSPAGCDAQFPTDAAHNMTGGQPLEDLLRIQTQFTSGLVAAPKSFKLFLGMLPDIMEFKGSWSKHAGGVLTHAPATVDFAAVRGSRAADGASGRHGFWRLVVGAAEGRGGGGGGGRSARRGAAPVPPLGVRALFHRRRLRMGRAHGAAERGEGFENACRARGKTFRRRDLGSCGETQLGRRRARALG